jgi:hypothetical protein
MTEYVRRAEAALRTGQPRLAELYMRRGLSESAGGRAWLARYDFGRALTAAGRELTRLYRDRYGPILDAFVSAAELTRADVALLPGPARGVPYAD